MEQPKKKPGRPRFKFDNKILEDLMRLYPTDKDTAYILGCNRDTLTEYIKKQYKMTFAEFRDKHMAKTRYQLQKIALTKALGGSVPLLIFCLKNFCGWSDNGHQDDGDNKIFWEYETQVS